MTSGSGTVFQADPHHCFHDAATGETAPAVRIELSRRDLTTDATTDTHLVPATKTGVPSKIAVVSSESDQNLGLPVRSKSGPVSSLRTVVLLV